MVGVLDGYKPEMEINVSNTCRSGLALVQYYEEYSAAVFYTTIIAYYYYHHPVYFVMYYQVVHVFVLFCLVSLHGDQ